MVQSFKVGDRSKKAVKQYKKFRRNTQKDFFKAVSETVTVKAVRIDTRKGN